mmetsp:Transcript_49858/g.120999  ORF Transcript_49858/g.120999 Transcript_49858/m.120999 type:complete len:428 (+) Transcript_49858:197-1480(+)
MSLADCIRREKGTKDPSEVEALCLDQAKCTEGLGALEPFAQLGSLSIQDAGISSLETLPALEYLTELKMSDNKIKGGLEHLLRCPNLERLYLAGNQIATLDALEKLSGLSKLELLDLEGNPVTKEPSYSTKVFDMFNNLIALDNKNRQGEEIEEDDDDDEDEAEEGYERHKPRHPVPRRVCVVDDVPYLVCLLQGHPSDPLHYMHKVIVCSELSEALALGLLPLCALGAHLFKPSGAVLFGTLHRGEGEVATRDARHQMRQYLLLDLDLAAPLDESDDYKVEEDDQHRGDNQRYLVPRGLPAPVGVLVGLVLLEEPRLEGVAGAVLLKLLLHLGHCVCQILGRVHTLAVRANLDGAPREGGGGLGGEGSTRECGGVAALLVVKPGAVEVAEYVAVGGHEGGDLVLFELPVAVCDVVALHLVEAKLLV